ncbi:hypothetical protein Sjap_015688 [Stephania japonica]|uniref:60S ribosomal protein L34 n=1 Tax=Stephania japonica TaxID=461633 RepID=A0AAP0NU76_9MAGN
MVQRLTYRKRHSYATKSNQNRVVKTPGGKLVYQTTKKRASGPKCPVTGKRIQGIPHLRPAEYKRSRLARNRRTVNRAYGGVLSGSAVRERIIRAFLVEEQKIVKKEITNAQKERCCSLFLCVESYLLFVGVLFDFVAIFITKLVFNAYLFLLTLHNSIWARRLGTDALNHLQCSKVLSNGVLSNIVQPNLFGEIYYCSILRDFFYSCRHVIQGFINLVACSCMVSSRLVMFYGNTCKDEVSWNLIISGCNRSAQYEESWRVFCGMHSSGIDPNQFTYGSCFNCLCRAWRIGMGRRVHGWVIKCGVGEDVYFGTSLVDLYVKCGDMNEAVKGFSRMLVRNVVSWTAIISGFVQKDDSMSALSFFKEMMKVNVGINNYTVTSVLAACAKPALSREAIQIHSWTMKTGLYSDSTVKTSLINTYSKIGEIGLSEMVFGEMECIKNLETWAVMISGFAQNQNLGRTIDLFRKMCRDGLRPDKFCSSSVLSIIDDITWGRQIHCYVFKAGMDFDVSVGSALSTMYSKCNSLVEAYNVFEEILDKDEVSWTSMIVGFAEHGCPEHALKLFINMPVKDIRPDQVILSAVLAACSALPSLRKGKEVHGYALRAGIDEDVLVGGALITMYSKCGSLFSAKRVFKMMPQNDQISWSSLLSGYAQKGLIEESLLLFHDMRITGLDIDCITISSLFVMAATLTKLVIGTQLHGLVMKTGLDSDVSVGSSLVTMYSRCGNIEKSHKVFDQIKDPDLIAWTSMIVGYAQHGKGTEALKLYELMRKHKVEPDAVTFVGVLSACGHNGLLEEGNYLLNSMKKDFGIEPGPRHYACMIDLLGRLGRLEEAVILINSMPIKPDALVWGTLLAACKKHGDVELGRLAANKVLELEPSESSAYISLSNIFANIGKWEEVLNIRILMKSAGLKKETGWMQL